MPDVVVPWFLPIMTIVQISHDKFSNHWKKKAKQNTNYENYNDLRNTIDPLISPLGLLFLCFYAIM